VLWLQGGTGGLGSALVFGIATALSSTAIILKQLHDLGQSRRAAAVIVTGILLLQDVIVIGIMLVLPIFAQNTGGGGWQAGALRTLAGAGALGVLALLIRPVLPKVLGLLLRVGGRELLALAAVLMACGGAWLAGLAGWSLALGSCVAGLLLAGTEMRHQLMADITPFQDIFNALFFISLGMLVDINAVSSHLILITAAVLATVVLKPALAALAVAAGGWPIRMGIFAGLALGTVSEFGYVLGSEASRMGLVSPDTLQVFIAYAVGTMMVGTLLLPAAEPFSGRLARRFGRSEPLRDAEQAEDMPTQHVIVVGYGTNGQNLTRVLRSTHIPHLVMEMNPKLVKAAQDAGEQVIVGDATRIPMLHHAGIETSRGLVVAINDPQATQRIVAQAHGLRPDLYVLARTSFVTEIDQLYGSGAVDVISEDFETSIEIAAHVLKHFGLPDNVVDVQISAIRAGRYAMLRGSATDRATQDELMKALELAITQTYYLEADNRACGRSLAELDLRARTGVTVIAVVRQGKATTNPSPDFCFQSGDILILLGAHAEIEAAKGLLAHE
jgi:CPA2 family monovalent cation:H+ antiporter-2